jgi:hypothetical protein
MERFKNQAPSDCVDEDGKVLYTSRVGPPPVPTTRWDEMSWARWNADQERLRNLHAEAEAAGFRVVAI